jgi:hypothetical protein
MVVPGENRSAGLGWPWRLGLRLAGAGLLAAAGAIHLDLYLTGYRTIPTIGWLFLLQDGGIRTAALHRLAGTVTASRCCPEVPAPQPQPLRTSPDDLAAEANPHKTELNPHKAVEAASAPEQIKRAFRARARARRHGSWQRRSCHAARDPLCP